MQARFCGCNPSTSTEEEGGADAIAIIVTGDDWQGSIDLGNGTLEVQADGDFRFTGDLNWFGQEHFSYDGDGRPGGSDTADVTVNVAPVNDAPVLDLWQFRSPARFAQGRYIGSSAGIGLVDSDAGVVEHR